MKMFCLYCMHDISVYVIKYAVQIRLNNPNYICVYTLTSGYLCTQAAAEVGGQDLLNLNRNSIFAIENHLSLEQSGPLS